MRYPIMRSNSKLSFVSHAYTRLRRCCRTAASSPLDTVGEHRCRSVFDSRRAAH